MSRSDATNMFVKFLIHHGLTCEISQQSRNLYIQENTDKAIVIEGYRVFSRGQNEQQGPKIVLLDATNVVRSSQPVSPEDSGDGTRRFLKLLMSHNLNCGSGVNGEVWIEDGISGKSFVIQRTPIAESFLTIFDGLTGELEDDPGYDSDDDLDEIKQYAPPPPLYHQESTPINDRAKRTRATFHLM